VSNSKYIANIGDRTFAAVEAHGIERITIKETFPGIKFPYSPFPKYATPDLRPKAGSKVEDAALLYQTSMIILKVKDLIAVLMK